jgi:ribosome-binding protein aMBF1 (putative translation factor)
MEHQDWEKVVIRSSKAASAAKQSTQVRVTDAVAQARKVAEMSHGAFKTLTHDARIAMASARVAKKLTQKQLDALGPFPPNSSNGWESGKSCPTGPQIQKLHRILGIKLERS